MQFPSKQTKYSFIQHVCTLCALLSKQLGGNNNNLSGSPYKLAQLAMRQLRMITGKCSFKAANLSIVCDHSF